jgi:hypothetical protein
MRKALNPAVAAGETDHTASPVLAGMPKPPIDRAFTPCVLCLKFMPSRELMMRDKTDREFLEELYNDMLRSITTREEFDTWLDKVERGFTWQQVLKDFTNSLEFHHRVQGIIDSVVGAGPQKAC